MYEIKDNTKQILYGAKRFVKVKRYKKRDNAKAERI